MSKLLIINVCMAWNGMRKHLLSAEPHNIEEWRALPLWTQHLTHILPPPLNNTTINNQLLRLYGILTIENISSDEGHTPVGPWRDTTSSH